MDYPKYSPLNSALLAFSVVAALYLFTFSLYSSNPFALLSKPHQCPAPNSTDLYVASDYQDQLETALKKASMANKTVIIAMINKAYADQDIKSDTTMLDLFLDSFWLGDDTQFLLDHLLLVAADQTAYERCQFLRLNCFKLETDSGVDFGGEKTYMSSDFIKMMWRRTSFLLDVLKRGYRFIFTDTDVMWLRNPLPKLSHDETEDIQISTDVFNGNPWSEHNLINTGFYFIRSNNKTITLFETWYGSKDNSTGMKEQDVLLELVRKGIIKQLELRVRFLDTNYFSGFCSDSKDFKAVTTVHANCCRSISAKIGDLRSVLRDWKKFKKFSSYKRLDNITSTFKWSGHWGCWSSWKPKNKTRNL